MPKPFFDIISNRSISALRTLYNTRLKVISTEAQILKVTLSDDYDSFGQYDNYIQDNIIENVVLNFSTITDREFFVTRDINGNTKIKGVAFEDILPIEMTIPFHVKNLFERDIFTTIFLDENDTKMPVIWQITQMKGSWRNRHLVKKTGTLSLYRDPLTPEQKLILDKYVKDYVI